MDEEIEFKHAPKREEAPEEEPPKQEPKPKVVVKREGEKKPSRKEQLIIDVLDLYPDQYDKAALSKMTMVRLSELKKNHKVRADASRLFPGVAPSAMPESEAECKELMGRTIDEKLADLAQDRPVVMSSAGVPGDTKAQKLSPELQFEMKANLKAKTLFNFHLVGGGILECLSEAEPVQQRLGTNLAGLTKDFIDDKETFIEVLKDLYTDYHEEIDPYINSITVYSLFMSNKLQARFMENKKKSLSGQSPKSPLKLENLLGLGPSQHASQPASSSSSAQQPSSTPTEKREDNVIPADIGDS